MLFRKRFTCKKSSLKSIRVFVSNALKNIGALDSDTEMLVLALDEICANRIIHSNSCNPNAYLDIYIFRKKEGIISFEIHDKGKSFNLLEYEEPCVNQLVKEKSTGGFGLILIKKIMDKIEVETKGKKNICRFTKELQSAQQYYTN